MTERKEICMQLKVGSCLGCNVLDIITSTFRWKRMTPENAARHIAPVYCPDGVLPQYDKIRNSDASHALGQEKKENTDFTERDYNPSGRKLHGQY